MFKEILLLVASQLCIFVIALTDMLLLSYFDIVVVVRVEAKTSSVLRY